MNQMFDFPQIFLNLGVAISGAYLLLLCLLYQAPGRSAPVIRPICIDTFHQKNAGRRS